MSTRSAIIEKRADGTYRGIYCHFDGYPDHHGPILLGHYTDPAKVSALIDLGDISQLGERVQPSGPHSYRQPADGVAVAYHRDRGEDFDGVRPLEGATAKDVADRIGHNGHVYLFSDGAWLHNGEPLVAVMAELAEADERGGAA